MPFELRGEIDFLTIRELEGAHGSSHEAGRRSEIYRRSPRIPAGSLEEARAKSSEIFSQAIGLPPLPGR
jgi:hypothetical protein